MGFWKRQKSKILIGCTLLTIATGALGVLKSEEARLKREIVGCERIIESKTRDGGIPEELKRIKEAIKQIEQLQEQQEEVQATETELQEIIEGVKHLEDYDFDSEREMLEREYLGVDKPLELIDIFERFSDEQIGI